MKVVKYIDMYKQTKKNATINLVKPENGDDDLHLKMEIGHITINNG